MERIISGRGTGKTRQLMELAKAENAIFICYNPYAMEQKANNYGITGLIFISYAQFLSQPKRVGDKFVIDELESFVSCISPLNTFIGYTQSEE